MRAGEMGGGKNGQGYKAVRCAWKHMMETHHLLAKGDVTNRKRIQVIWNNKGKSLFYS